jgi:AraC-like DNA-binding protein
MRLVEIRLPFEYDKSFIFYHETGPFAKWHNHPEYELVMIVKGRGKRSIGDSIDRFEGGEVVFMGPYVPHEYVCDPECFEKDPIESECIVIQFDHTFLGKQFFQLPENKPLMKFLSVSNYGCKFTKSALKKISSIMLKMVDMDDLDRLYALFSIFQIISRTDEYELISNPQNVISYNAEEDDAMNKVREHLHRHFNEKIKVSELLNIALMSNSSFCAKFKQTFRMPFQEYLIKLRIAYACKMMIENTKCIAEIADKSGFSNISNFNRQFKRIKKITPSDYISLKHS